jgi:hypothetical protein
MNEHHAMTLDGTGRWVAGEGGASCRVAARAFLALPPGRAAARCNTAEGLGSGIQGAGEAIKKSAR